MYVEVSEGAAPGSGVPLAVHPHLETGVNSSGNSDYQSAHVFPPPGATAFRAQPADHLAVAMTPIAGDHIDESPENAALDALHPSSAAAVSAAFRLGTLLCAAAPAIRAVFHPRHLYFPVAAENRLLK